MEKKMAPKVQFIPHAGSPRHPLAHAIIAALNALLEGLPDAPLPTRVELRTIRARLARLYKIELVVSPTDQEWEENPDEEIPE